MTPAAPTAFFSKTYDEALALLEESRAYLAAIEPIDRQRLGLLDRLSLCCEITRLTARLTQVTAWLLFQRAACAGEIAYAEAVGGSDILADIAVCMDRGEAATLPRRVSALLDRSHELYVRVARLDQLARRQAA